jgi:hypothetical protein
MPVDWLNIGSAYSNFAGIMAGFAFSGIYLLLEDRKGKVSEVISILLVGFFGLLLAAFPFANTGGMATNQNTPEQDKITLLHGVIASVIFAISIIQMFLSLVFIFIVYDLPREVIILGMTVYYGASFVVAMFIIRSLPVIQNTPTERLPITNGLYVTAGISALILLALLKSVREKLDDFFENHFTHIMIGTFVFMLFLTAVYNMDALFKTDIPIIFDHLLILIVVVNMMVNNFSMHYEYRSAKEAKDQTGRWKSMRNDQNNDH